MPQKYAVDSLVNVFWRSMKHMMNRVMFGGTLVVGLITEPLGFVQDARYVMVPFDEW